MEKKLKNRMRAVVGIDFGTLSARAIAVNAEDGRVLATHSFEYPHGILPGDLALCQDYDRALMFLLDALSKEPFREDIAAICVDATSLTLVPIAADGRVLSAIPSCRDRPQAQVKLWKRHAAKHQADEALSLARRMHEPFLGRTGGSVSSEWMLPKLMEMYDEDPDAYKMTDLALDLCDYLTLLLTGKLTRSAGSMSFKGLWARDLGLPSEDYLNALRPEFSLKYRHVMRGEVLRPGDPAGILREDLRARFSFSKDVVIAAGTVDGHTSLAALGGLNDGDAVMVLGTSNAFTVQTRTLHEMDGICGIALHGLTPGLYGIDAGQNCTGDMMGWYIQNALPADILKASEDAHVTPHQYLCARIHEPWKNPVTALDWWNGSRNAPCDLDLRGTMAGISIDTRPEDIYLALLQAIVCGSREIMEHLIDNGVAVHRILATGGIAKKNPLLVQEYANIFHLPIAVAQVSEGPAMGSAIFAAVAAGIHPDVPTAYAHMGVKDFEFYHPDEAHYEDYERIYRRNHALRRAMIALRDES